MRTAAAAPHQAPHQASAPRARAPHDALTDSWVTDPTLLHLDERGLSALVRAPLLTAEDEVALAHAAEAGALAEERLTDPRPDDDLAELAALVRNGQAALRRLVLSNVRFVAWHARRRLAAGYCVLGYLDLVHEGLLGLIRAAHKWDYQRGLKFSTYATYWIRSYQQRAERRARGLSVAVDEQLTAIRRTREDLTAELSRTPTTQEVADRLGLAASRISALETHQQPVLRLDSTDMTDRHDLANLGERVADVNALDPEAATVAAAEADRLREVMGLLPARHQRVISMRFGLDGEPPAEIDEIARRCQVPPARVAATVGRALDLLRGHLTPAADED